MLNLMLNIFSPALKHLWNPGYYMSGLFFLFYFLRRKAYSLLNCLFICILIHIYKLKGTIQALTWAGTGPWHKHEGPKVRPSFAGTGSRGGWWEVGQGGGRVKWGRERWGRRKGCGERIQLLGWILIPGSCLSCSDLATGIHATHFSGAVSSSPIWAAVSYPGEGVCFPLSLDRMVVNPCPRLDTGQVCRPAYSTLGFGLHSKLRSWLLFSLVALFPPVT